MENRHLKDTSIQSDLDMAVFIIMSAAPCLELGTFGLEHMQEVVENTADILCLEVDQMLSALDLKDPALAGQLTVLLEK